jgi:O-antigen/teichoic acid export membrane protein
MQKKFISNLAFLVILNFLVKPIAIFGIDATVQNQVGADSYGIYFSLLNFSMLFNIILDFGINNFTTKNIAQYPHIASKYIGKILIFRLILFVFYAVFSFSIAFVLNWNTYELYLLSFLVLNQMLVTFIAYIRSHFSGLLLFKTEAILGILDRLLLIFICGAVLYFPVSNVPFKIEWFIWIQTICYSITLIIGFILLFGKIKLPKLKYNAAFSIAIIRKSFPYALLILLMMVYTRVDSVMIERMHINGKAESAYYAKGFRLVNAFFMFAMLFSNLLLPLFSRMFQNKEDVSPLFSTASKLLVGGSILLAIVSFFNSEYILSLIYTNEIEVSSPSFQLLMISFIGMCSTIIFGTLLTAKGNMKFLNAAAGIGIVINFGINFYLIPIYGATGAAIATCITQTIVSGIQLAYCIKELKIPFSAVFMIRFVLFVGSLFAMSYFIHVDSILLLFAVLLLAFISMIVFRFIDIKALYHIVKSNSEE